MDVELWISYNFHVTKCYSLYFFNIISLYFLYFHFKNIKTILSFLLYKIIQWVRTGLQVLIYWPLSRMNGYIWFYSIGTKVKPHLNSVCTCVWLFILTCFSGFSFHKAVRCCFKTTTLKKAYFSVPSGYHCIAGTTVHAIWHAFFNTCVNATCLGCDKASFRASQVAQLNRDWLLMQEMQVRPLGQRDPLEEEMATHCGIPA